VLNVSVQAALPVVKGLPVAALEVEAAEHTQQLPAV
jgi:hypothetical protein